MITSFEMTVRAVNPIQMQLVFAYFHIFYDKIFMVTAV